MNPQYAAIFNLQPVAISPRFSQKQGIEHASSTTDPASHSDNKTTANTAAQLHQDLLQAFGEKITAIEQANTATPHLHQSTLTLPNTPLSWQQKKALWIENNQHD